LLNISYDFPKTGNFLKIFLRSFANVGPDLLTLSQQTLRLAASMLLGLAPVNCEPELTQYVTVAC